MGTEELRKTSVRREGAAWAQVSHFHVTLTLQRCPTLSEFGGQELAREQLVNRLESWGSQMQDVKCATVE